MRSWPNSFQTWESASSQFVCLRVWISTVTASFHSASNKTKQILLHVLLEELLEGICIHVRQESLMHWTCNCLFFCDGALGTRLHKQACVSTGSHQDTHINLSLFDGGLHVQRINSVSCSAALRCRSRKAFAALNIIHTQTLSHAQTHTHDSTSHNHTASILFPDQHNAFSPPQLFLSPSQPGTRFLLVALCAVLRGV